MRKAVRVRDHFPSDETAAKLLFLAFEVGQNWKMGLREWNAARTQFAVIFGDRFAAELGSEADPHTKFRLPRRTGLATAAGESM